MRGVNYQLHGVIVGSEIALPGVRRSTAGSRPSIAISIDGARADERFDAFHHWRIKGTRGPWLSIARRGGGYALRFPDLADFDVSGAGDRIVCRPKPRLPASTLQHLLLDQVLPLALSQSGHLVLHASAAHIPRLGCIALVGPTGSGKSTLAAALALHGCAVVTDDCLVVQPGTAKSLAVPGYPGLRLWRDAARELGLGRSGETRVAHYTAKRRVHAGRVAFRSKPSPLVAVFVLGRRLRPAAAIRSRVLSSRDRLMALAPYTHLMDVEDRQQLGHMFRSLTALDAEVPVVRLSVPEGRRRVLETADYLTALARTLVNETPQSPV